MLICQIVVVTYIPRGTRPDLPHSFYETKLAIMLPESVAVNEGFAMFDGLSESLEELRLIVLMYEVDKIL